MSFEYDPHNKLRHTSYWYESDAKAEWPLSENAKEEEPPREDEPFDYMAKPNKFYMEVETDGSMGPQEVVMKVCTYQSDEPYFSIEFHRLGPTRASNKTGQSHSRAEGRTRS